MTREAIVSQMVENANRGMMHVADTEVAVTSNEVLSACFTLLAYSIRAVRQLSGPTYNSAPLMEAIMKVVEEIEGPKKES